MTDSKDTALRAEHASRGWNWQVQPQGISNARTGLRLSFESTGHQALPFSLTIDTPEGVSQTFIFDGIGNFHHSEANEDIEPMRQWLKNKAEGRAPVGPKP
jgi:hypothetical protein